MTNLRGFSQKQQLFKTLPDAEITQKVLDVFGLKGLDDTTNFTRRDLKILNTIEKLNDLKPELERFYYPCKARLYLNALTPKTAITVLRQILRANYRTLASRERYSEGHKSTWYQLIPNGTFTPICITHSQGLMVYFD